MTPYLRIENGSKTIPYLAARTYNYKYGIKLHFYSRTSLEVRKVGITLYKNVFIINSPSLLKKGWSKFFLITLGLSGSLLCVFLL